MTLEVRMPQMGESLAEGTVVKWHKQVGEQVRRDEPLFEISTDKVDTEVPSPSDGYLSRIFVKEGETVPVNTVVCALSDTSSPPAPSDGAHEMAPPDPVSANTGAPSPGSERTASGAAVSLEQRLREKSSPFVRRLAAKHGIDLSRLEGSGLAGRVTKEDLLEIIAGSNDQSDGQGLPGTLEPMSVMRKSIAEHMTRSLNTSAHVSTVFEADMTQVRAARETLRRRHSSTKLTYLPFILRATAQGLRHFPILNAAVEGESVRFHESVNLGVAVALEDGLIVPVIRDADKKTVIELAGDVHDLATRARAKQLLPEDVHGGTFTVTSPGVFGGLIGTPIINQPQVGILYVGTIQKRAVVLPDTDIIAARPMAYISLSFDHRIIDGAVADRFMAKVKSTLEADQLQDAASGESQ